MIDDYWGPAKRVMGDPKFIENISNTSALYNNNIKSLTLTCNFVVSLGNKSIKYDEN